MVKDTGIGIAAADLPKVYNEFYRAENARRFNEEGTGLGLSIVGASWRPWAVRSRWRARSGRERPSPYYCQAALAVQIGRNHNSQQVASSRPLP